ncbi:MAG: hypothetical protein ACRD3T_19525, partial [Terriglobia bacterium]
PNLLKQDASFSIDRFGQDAVQLRFRVTNLGAPDPQEKSRSETTPALRFLSSDPTDDGLMVDVRTDDGFDPVPNFFKAIIWSLLLFVALPAVVIFGIYWLIWR